MNLIINKNPYNTKIAWNEFKTFKEAEVWSNDYMKGKSVIKVAIKKEFDGNYSAYIIYKEF